jgi:hypothetical protein
MTMHTHRWTAVTAALSALVLAASAAGVWAQDGDGDDSDHGRNVVPLKDARLKIEFNATDQDIQSDQPR